MDLLSALNNLYTSKSLPFVTLIHTNNLEKAFCDLNAFTQRVFEIDLKRYNQNTVVVRPETNGNINIDQVRNLKNLLYKTTTHDYKVAVINQAENMNVNCANACLKLLEEPASNTYIFLISRNPNQILATVRSRCHKLKCYYDTLSEPLQYIQILNGLLRGDILGILEEIDLKNDWDDFLQSCVMLVSKMIKYQTKCEVDFVNDNEKLLFAKLKLSTETLLNNFEEINSLAIKSINQDLERKSIALIILNLFSDMVN
jgi:hypothetical protein